jgi:hypothetical protein
MLDPVSPCPCDERRLRVEGARVELLRDDPRDEEPREEPRDDDLRAELRRDPLRLEPPLRPLEPRPPDRELADRELRPEVLSSSEDRLDRVRRDPPDLLPCDRPLFDCAICRLPGVRHP